MAALTGFAGLAKIAPVHSGRVIPFFYDEGGPPMPGDCSHLSRIVPILMCLPALGYLLLRPQLLTGLSALPTCCID